MAKAKIANPRWLWIMALVLGAICTIAFVAMTLAPAEAPAPGPSPSPPAGRGFGSGLLVGGIGGVAIGFAIARYRSHSSRKSP